MPGVVRAIVCTRGPRPTCACGRRASLQCDAPSNRRSGTCDRHLCAKCATEVGTDKHLCQAHAEQRAAATPVAPAQGGLF
jgi:hypothetical protein